MDMTKAERIYALVDQWKESCKTQKVFCREHDVKLGTGVAPVLKYSPFVGPPIKRFKLEFMLPADTYPLAFYG